MLKKKMLLCFTIIMLFFNMQESILAVTDSIIDYSEEIEMFGDFYQNPSNYIFQDINGEEINQFILQYEDAFYKNENDTTEFLMNYVRSVQKTDQIISLYDSKSITWSNLKIYFSKTQYCVYSVTGIYNVVNDKITTGSARYSIIKSSARSYTIRNEANLIDKSGKRITYNLLHTFNDSIKIRTKHSVTI